MILIIYLALFRGRSVIWYAFFSGLAIDIFKQTLGIHALIYTSLGYLIYFIGFYIYRDNLFVQFLILILSSLIKEVLLTSLTQEISLFFLVRYNLPQALYTAFIGLIIINIFKFIYKSKG